MEGKDLTLKLNQEFNDFFKSAFKVVKGVPGYFFPMLRHLFNQWRASHTRLKKEAASGHIPPFLIFSITKQCNLKCKGCYAKHLHHHIEPDLSLDKIDEVFHEAESLGINIILLAGGEPLMRKGIVPLANTYPKIIFPVFTNGLLIDDPMAADIAKGKNILPVISLEGDLAQTDQRRGQGVYQSALQTFKLLRKHHILFGTSVTVTRENFEHVSSDVFIKNVQQHGCSVIFFIEYIPCSENSEKLVITKEQRQELKQRIEAYKNKGDMVIVSFPGDEDVFGGCLAAGRGFVHISSSGAVEPCPFSPYSDISIQSVSLETALKSRFLKTIRENHDALNEHAGGCALWENREWVSQALAAEVKNDV